MTGSHTAKSDLVVYNALTSTWDTILGRSSNSKTLLTLYQSLVGLDQPLPMTGSHTAKSDLVVYNALTSSWDTILGRSSNSNTWLTFNESHNPPTSKHIVNILTT